MARRYAKETQYRRVIDQVICMEWPEAAKRQQESDESDNGPELCSDIAFENKGKHRQGNCGQADVANVFTVEGRTHVRCAKQLSVATSEDIGRKKCPQEVWRQTERGKE